MHALCYPLLQQRSPAWGLGTEEGPAYLLHMPTLFERFCTAFIDHKLNHRGRNKSPVSHAPEGNGAAFLPLGHGSVFSGN